MNKILMGGVLGLMITLLPTYSEAASCSFTRNLELGDLGEDVKCLQQYLNGAGYTVSDVGAGSVGKETDEFKSLTKEALIRWQTANKISPASGYFGPLSRGVYERLMKATPSDETSNNNADKGLADSLLAKLKSLQEKQATEGVSVNATNTSVTTTADQKSVHNLLKDTLDAVDDAKEAIDESDDADAIEEAEDNLEDAENRLFAGLRSYLSGDYLEAIDILKRALSSAEDAIEEAGGSSVKQEAKDLIDEMGDRLDEVEDLIDEADEEGESVSEAEDLFEEAEDLLDEAEEIYDEEDYDEALDLAEEVEDLLDEAEEAIGNVDDDDIEDMLEEASDELDDAKEAVEEAIDNDEDVGDAEDLLDEAEELLDDAGDAISDGDDDEAEDLIEEALDLIDEALDEF